MIYIANSFSLQMLPSWRLEPDATIPGWDTTLVVEPLADPAAWLAQQPGDEEVASAVGHADTAALFTGILGRPIAAARVSVELGDDDVALVGQIVGGRLPEGATTLPAGVSIRWLAVSIKE